MSFFSKKPTLDEQMREQNRDLRRAQREVEKERLSLEKQEKQLITEIQKPSNQGNKPLLTHLAKGLVNLRKKKAQNYHAASKITSIGNKTKAMHSSAKLAKTMANTTKTMVSANKEINPQEMARTMHDFEKETMKMGMAEEIVDDTLNSVLTESGDEEEEDAVVNQVLDEIGIEISGKLSKAPLVSRGAIGETSKVVDEDDELVRQLAQLRT